MDKDILEAERGVDADGREIALMRKGALVI
jgi:hypothetical protein